MYYNNSNQTQQQPNILDILDRLKVDYLSPPINRSFKSRNKNKISCIDNLIRRVDELAKDNYNSKIASFQNNNRPGEVVELIRLLNWKF